MRHEVCDDETPNADDLNELRAGMLGEELARAGGERSASHEHEALGQPRVVALDGRINRGAVDVRHNDGANIAYLDASARPASGVRVDSQARFPRVDDRSSAGNWVQDSAVCRRTV